MSAVSSLSSPDEGWEAVLVAILESEEQGRPLPLAEWQARHPSHAEALAAFFADRSAFDSLLTRPVLNALGEQVRYFGDYELLSEIARGGMGVIYRARQVNLQRDVALKMVLGGRFAGPADLERFRREAQAISQLDHPGIVPLYEIGEHQQQHYFTMKLVNGGSLADRLGNRPLEPAVAAKLIATVAQAVHYAHQRGILHRDLKPANILLEQPDDLTPLVADFGLSRPLEGSPNPTRTGAILGTPTYMAPEQARAEKQLTTAVDVYSLGALLYELLTGRPPFRGASIAETLNLLQHAEPTAPRTLNPKIDRDLETITLKCLAKSPPERYASAEALAADLERWRSGKPIEARPVTAMEHVIKWTRRKPAVAALMTALAASIVLGLVGMAYQVRQTRAARLEAEARADAEGVERERAQTAERNVEAQRDRAEQSLYFNRTASALRYWQDGNLVKAATLLENAPEQYRNWEWQHLQRLMHPEESSIPGYGFHMTTDQKRMFVLHWQCADLWDVKAWKQLKRIEWGKDQRFVTSPDGRRYAVFGSKADTTPSQRSHSLTVHDTETGALIWKNDAFPIQAFEIRTAVFSPDNHLMAVCGSQTNCAQGGDAGSTTVVIDGNTGATKYTLKQGGLAAAFSPDGKTLAAVEEKMDLLTEQRQSVPPGAPPMDNIIPHSWHWPEGKNIQFGDRLCRRDSWISLLEPATGKPLGKLTHPEGYGVAQHFTWSPDSKSIFDFGRGCTNVYDVATRKFKTKLAGHNDGAASIAFTANSNIIITGGSDHSIKEWNIKEGKSTREWKGHQQYVGSVAVIDNGRTLLSGGGDHTIRRWRFHQSHGMVDTPNYNEIEPSNFANGVEAHGAFHWASGASRDGRRSVVLDQYVSGVQLIQAMFGSESQSPDMELSLIDTATQRPLKTFKTKWQSDRMSHQAMQIRISPDDRFAAACFNSQPALLDLKTGAEHFLPFRSGDSIAFSPDSRTLATVQQLTEQIFQPHQPVKGIAAYTAPPPEIVPKPTVVEATLTQMPVPLPTPPVLPPEFGIMMQQPSFLRLWDVDTRKETTFVTLEQFACDGLNYSPDGTRIVVWGYGPVKASESFNTSRELRIIDVPNRKVLTTLKGSHMNHREAVFNADNTLVTAASWDGNVYVWNVADGKLLHTLRGHQGYVWSAVFTPDGKRIISSGNDMMLKVWDTVTGEDVISFPNEGGSFRLEFDATGQLRGHGNYTHRHWQTPEPR